jgi:hypothetical protein
LPARVDENADPLLNLLQRFHNEGVKYILVGGHAVRLNGFLRSTEDIDILLPASIENGETYEFLQAHVRTLSVDDVEINTLDIEGLLKTKTSFSDKDQIDRRALSQILARLKAD